MTDWVLLGSRAIRFARPTGPSTRALVRAIRKWPNVVDVVVARDDVAAYFGKDLPGTTSRPNLFGTAERVDFDPLIAALAKLRDVNEPVREIDLEVKYGGPDLDEIARSIDATVDEIVRLHSSATYVVETIGFAPGFAYMTGLDARLAAIPRRTTPRPRVPGGSLAIAGGFTAVYPFDSPGGWNLIGRVEQRMFGDEGALLRLGDRVRFKQWFER